MNGSEMPTDTATEAAWLLRVASRLAGPGEAEDLAQQALLTAHEQPPDPSRPRRAWLRVVTRRFALMSRRRRARWDANAWRLEGSGEAAGADDVVHRARVLDAVKAALDELSESDRDIVVRRYFLEHDTERVAADLGLQPGTVRTRLSRALTRLRTRLDDDFGGREAWAGLLLLPDRAPATSGLSTGAAWAIGAVAVLGLAAFVALASSTNETAVGDSPAPDEAKTEAAALAAAGPDSETADPPAPAPDRRDLRKAILAAHASTFAARTDDARQADAEGSLPALSSVGAFSDFKELAADLREATIECLPPPDDATSASGRLRFRVHLIAEPDVGALIDELELDDDEVGDAGLRECLEQSIPAFSIPPPRGRYAQDLDIVVDVGRRHIAVHADLVVDDLPTFLDELRDFGFPEEMLERERARVETAEDRTIRFGWLSPYEKQEVAP